MTTRFGILGLVMLGGVLLASLALAPAPAVAQKLPSQAKPKLTVLQKTLQTCFACHGENGISSMPSRPTIAGQKGTYIAKQLLAFLQAAKAHEVDQDNDSDDNNDAQGGVQGLLRTDPIMEHMVSGLESALIPKIAAAVSQLACRTDVRKVPTVPKPAPAAAQACALCHGVDGRGKRSDTPILAGQQRAYLRRQLLLIRESAWGALPREGEALRSHPIMESQVARLKIQDVDALAKYYAKLDCLKPNATY